jgi:hypothetical protein
MRIITAVLALLAGLVPAAAADVYSTKDSTPAPHYAPVEQTYSWTGIWLGALAGYGMSNTELNLDIFSGDESANLANVDGFGGEGFEATVQVGGDIQIGRLVAGLGAEYTFGGIESSASVMDGAARLDVEMEDSWCITGRLGIPSGRTLFYGLSGWCEYSGEATVRMGDESASQDLDFSGIPLEFGVEHQFAQNVRGKLAGRYTFLDEEVVGRFGDEESGGRLSAEPGVFTIKAGIVISTGGIGTGSGLGIFSSGN